MALLHVCVILKAVAPVALHSWLKTCRSTVSPTWLAHCVQTQPA